MRVFDLLGTIVPDDDAWLYRWFGFTVTSPKDLREAIRKAGKEPLKVRINSYGGDVWSASDMYTMLRQHEPGVEVEVTGLAASAATVVMMAGNRVRASPTSEMMIHNPSAHADGDHRIMEQTAESLKNTRETIVNAYELKTGMSREKLRGMMNAEKWMTAQSAKEKGFVDEIMFTEADELKDEPETDSGSGAGTARTAAINMPSVSELRARWAVWNEIAPGSESIDEARARIADGQGETIPRKQDEETPDQRARALIMEQIRTLGT